MAYSGSTCPCLNGATATYGPSGNPDYPLLITVALNSLEEGLCPITGIQFDGQGAVSIGECTLNGLTLTVTCKPPALAPGQYRVKLLHVSGGQHEGILSTYFIKT